MEGVQFFYFIGNSNGFLVLWQSTVCKVKALQGKCIDNALPFAIIKSIIVTKGGYYIFSTALYLEGGRICCYCQRKISEKCFP